MKAKALYSLIALLLVAVSWLVFNTLQLEALVSSLQAEKESLAEANADLTEQLQSSIDRLRDLESYGIGVDGSTTGKIAYLTFDDGPSANTADILDILKRYQIKATFFVIGNTSPESLRLYQRIVDEGHSLGLHGYSHDYALAYQSVDAYMENLYRLQDFLYTTVGQRPTIMRFLGGSNTSMGPKYGSDDLMQQLAAKVTADGLKYFDWNVSSADASRPVVSADVIADAVLSGARRQQRAVILMHDAPIKTTTVDALPTIIEGLRAQGFRFAGLAESSPTIHFEQR